VTQQRAQGLGERPERDTPTWWRYRYLAIGLSVLISGLGFLSVDAYNASRADRLAPLALETPLDHAIPFVPAFVFAYLLYYPWLFLPFTVLRSRRDLYPVILAFASMQLVATIIFLTFPSYAPGVAITSGGLAGELLRFIRTIDQGWNAFPSLHVGHSVLVAMVFWQHRRELFPFVAAGTCAIAASTLLIKQHYALDLFGGAVLAWLCMSAATLRSRAELNAIARSLEA
jgi:membrane-associated phospholipid phosphatase